MRAPQPVIFALLSLSLAGPWLAGCGDTCTTDGDCAEGGICVNGQCRGGVGGDAGASDAGVGFDLSQADVSAADLARPDLNAMDGAGPDLGAVTDAARPDSGARDHGAATDSASAGDTGVIADASVADAGAADASTADVGAADAAGPDVYSGLIGAPCRDHDDCDTPFGAYCLDSWPDGYCSAACNYEGGAFECGQGAECYCEMMDSMGCAIASCFQTCWRFDIDCRDEYRCEDPDWLGYLGDEDLCVP